MGLASYLRENLPDHTSSLNQQELDDKITLWQERAGAYAVSSQRSVAKWCLLSLLAGDYFENIPQVQEYLKRPEPDASAKVDYLLHDLWAIFLHNQTL